MTKGSNKKSFVEGAVVGAAVGAAAVYLANKDNRKKIGKKVKDVEEKVGKAVKDEIATLRKKGRPTK